MAQLKLGSAGVTATEVDLSGPLEQEPVGVPAGIIGTSVSGPAFVPITVGLRQDFYAKFGFTDGKKFGPLAAVEWLRNRSSATFVRVLGVGDGKRRNLDGNLAGSVTNAGFVVGEEQPDSDNDGLISSNAYANSGGPEGRTYLIGCLMSESQGSTYFSDANLQGDGSVNPLISGSFPVLRGMLLAPSGVVIKMSSSFEGSSTNPGSSDIADPASGQGTSVGSVVLLENSTSKSDFVLLLNGHKGTDSRYPNVITASFDMTSPNYFANVLNSDPLSSDQAGHYLYSSWDIHPTLAVITGSGAVATGSGAGATVNDKFGTEPSAFILSSSLARNVGSTTVPNFENFENRYSHAKSPWFSSQKFGGNRENLFRLHAYDSGFGTSNNFKISIENISPSTDLANKYGSFDVVIRNFTDRDTDKNILEAHRGVNLDPTDDRYVAKIIGDANVYFDFDKSETGQKLIVDGQYPLRSNFVRVEVASSVDQSQTDPTALPFGFRGHSHLQTSGSAPMSAVASTVLDDNEVMKRVVQPPVTFRNDITAGSGNKQTVNPLLYWGVKFEHDTSLTTPNASTLKNKSLLSFAKFYPDYMTATTNVVIGDNENTPDTDENGVIDADRFNLGAFSLDNIKVQTGSNGLADTQQWVNSVYVRNGNIVADDSAKTRKLDVSDFTSANKTFLKFTTFMQGGFDGVNIFDKNESEINNVAVDEDMNDDNRGRSEGPNVKAYDKALDLMKSTTNVDIQLLATPGIRNPIITNAAIDAVETRFDAMYVMDIEQEDVNGDLSNNDNDVIDVTKTLDRHANRSLDTSFAAAYFPDTVMTDPNTKTNLIVPPSVVVLGALGLNDKVAHPWFAPAGTTRGALPTALEARVQLSKEDMDALADGDINPLVAFPGNPVSGTNPKGGVVVWGQKTLQQAQSALDRVNVRRLLIDIRRQIRDITRTFIFEPNRESTLSAFSDAVKPRLQRVQKLAGLNSFKVLIDTTTTTEQDVINNTIRGKIFVQPTKSVEFVSLDFVVSNSID